jgi:hypothetical protein
MQTKLLFLGMALILIMIGISLMLALKTTPVQIVKRLNHTSYTALH